jgi:hypothetical protein
VVRHGAKFTINSNNDARRHNSCKLHEVWVFWLTSQISSSYCF